MVQIRISDFTVSEKMVSWRFKDRLFYKDLLQHMRIYPQNQQCHYSAALQSCDKSEQLDKLYFCADVNWEVMEFSQY